MEREPDESLAPVDPLPDDAQLVRAQAPGRVNLMGEHTDYNGGFVLPIVIPQQASVSLRPRADRSVHLFSRQLGPARPYELGAEQRAGGWWDGAALALSAALRAVPAFVVGIALMLWLAVEWDWLPVAGVGGWREVILPALTLALGLAAVEAPGLLGRGVQVGRIVEHLRLEADERLDTRFGRPLPEVLH